MLLRMTLLDARTGDVRRVEVRAEEHHVARQLRGALGVPAGAVLRTRDEPVPDGTPVGRPPLLDGAALVVGPPGEDGSAKGAPTRAAPLRLTTVAGPDAGRELALSRGTHVVGRGEVATLRVADDALSREHVELVVDRDGVLVRDLTSTNGTTVDGDPVPPAGTRVRVGAVLRAGRTRFVLDRSRPRPSRRRPTGAGTLAVSPAPHVPPPRDAPTIQVPDEPRAPRRRAIPWVMVLAPVPVAAVMALLLGPRLLLLLVMTPLLVLASTLTDRSTTRREHRSAHAEWRVETARLGRRLSAALAAERRSRLQASPDPVALLDAAREDGPRLWQRRPDHDEHLDLRIGLGDAPSATRVQRGSRPPEHPVVRDVPITVDLAEVGVLGVAGPRPARDRLARHLLGQLLVLHSPHDLRLALVADEEGWCAPFVDLVHLREHDDVPGSARTADDPEEVRAVLAAAAASVADAAEAGPESLPPPDLVVVIDDIARWRAETNLRTVLADRGEHGVHVLALADSPDGLPHEARAVVLLEGAEATVHVAGEQVARCVVDGVGASWAARVGTALAPLRDATPSRAGGGLPTTTRLLDLLETDPDDLESVRAWWSRERTGPVDLEVVVGASPDGVHGIDLRRDGPHALVAGTTGAGKSELLQSWVAALALHLTPEEISFVLVDYKGGSAFGECADLPHTVGVLTDLDATAAQRALASLDAELTRREQVLAAAGSPDIDRHEGSALPRLMIVVDEFRMLAEEQPEALAHLMRIATVGRSLGVHLVLATQRPGGIVSADIRANVNLRIALRVRDRADSEDVIGCRDAAGLPEEAPGRAISRTGGGPPRTFQTGRVAGRARAGGPSLLVREVGQPWPRVPATSDPGPSDLRRLAATLSRVADDLDVPAPHRPWLPPLPSVITAAEVAATDPDDEDGAPFGLVDLPASQQQVPLRWSPADGSWMILGGPATGRTTAVASLVTAVAGTFAPGQVHVHIIGDGSASLAALGELPHIGSVVDAGDPPVLRRLLDRLESEVSRRREAARVAGRATLAAWWQAHDAGKAERPPPYLVVAVDGWGRLRPPGSLDPAEPTDRLEALLRDGTAVGLRLVVTGGRELLGGRIASLAPTRLVLHLPDRGDAVLAGIPAARAEGPAVPGRAHLVPGGHEVQVALPSPAAGLPIAPATGPADRPWAVTPLPVRVDLDELTVAGAGGGAGARVAGPGGVLPHERVPLGVGGCGSEVLSWSPDSERRLLVCGPAGSGRSTTLSVLLDGLTRSGRTVVVIGDAGTGPRGDHVRLGPEDREQLLELRRARPDLAVLVDDLDRLEEAPVADVLREVVRRVDADRGVVVATTSPRAAAGVRGLVADVARARAGVLLQPTSRGDGDPFGVRVASLPRVAGRGYLIASGAPQEVQVALPRAPGSRAA